MIDLSQVSMMLRGATARSLLILDEFGKGEPRSHSWEELGDGPLGNRHAIPRRSRIVDWNIDGISGKGGGLPKDRKCLFIAIHKSNR
jgi:hypothetical protein